MYSLCSLVSPFAGLLILLFRYKWIVFILIGVQCIFLIFLIQISYMFIFEDKLTVEYQTDEAREDATNLVLQIACIHGIRMVIFVFQLLIMMFRFKIEKPDEEEEKEKKKEKEPPLSGLVEFLERNQREHEALREHILAASRRPDFFISTGSTRNDRQNRRSDSNNQNRNGIGSGSGSGIGSGIGDSSGIGG